MPSTSPTPPARSRDLVLGLGNDILGDDGVGLVAARALRDEFQSSVDIVETAEAGLALLEFLEGYDRALLLDSIATGRHAAGTVLEFSPKDFQALVAPSPHFSGLPDILRLAARLGVSAPADIRILAMEIHPGRVIGETLSAPVQRALPDFIARARAILLQWQDR